MAPFLLVVLTATLILQSVEGALDPAVNERLDKLERLLVHQENRIKYLEKENAKWREEKLTWDREKEELKQTVVELKLKMVYSHDNWPAESAKNGHVAENTFSPIQPSTQLSGGLSRAKWVDKIRTDSHTVDRELSPRADDPAVAWEAVADQLSQKLAEVSAELQALKDVTSQHETTLHDSRASVYVRWGRSVCPSSDSLVYSGYVGGSWYNTHGGAGNYLCLTKLPVTGTHTFPRDMALLYGGEYQTDFDSHYQADPPCAVCRSPHPTTMMVPGTNQCPSDWSREYEGFLMTQAEIYPAASEYICVDSSFEERPGGQTNNNGKLLFFTVTRCGALPCPPYENNTIVTCAVCSK